MTQPAFDEFCTRLSAALGMPCPDLRADPDAPWAAMTLTFDDVEIGLMQANDGDPDWAMVMLEFGPLPPEGEALACRTLLESNFLLMGAVQPVFSLHPTQGTVFVQQGFPLNRVDAPAFEAHVRQLADAARRWRAGEFMSPEFGDDPRAGSAAMATAMAAHRA